MSLLIVTTHAAARPVSRPPTERERLEAQLAQVQAQLAALK